MFNQFHHCKFCHAAACNHVSLVALKAGLLADRVTIYKENSEGHVNGKVVNQLQRFMVSQIGQSATRAGATHLLDVSEHLGPVISKMQTMQRPVCIQMATNWVGVECYKKYVLQVGGYNLKSGVRGTAPDRLAIN